MATLFLIIQLFYWLSLSTWLGSVAFIAISIPVITRTIRENDPTLPTVLSVNLDGAHSSLLTTTVVVNLLSVLVRIELACLSILLLTLAGQWAALGSDRMIITVIRSCLLAAAGGVAAYDWRAVSPRVARYRKEYIDRADEPEAAKAARDQFERHYRESLTLLMLQAFILSGLVLFSTMISMPAQTFTVR
jgi:hypothetical protein